MFDVVSKQSMHKNVITLALQIYTFVHWVGIFRLQYPAFLSGELLFRHPKISFFPLYLRKTPLLASEEANSAFFRTSAKSVLF